MNIKNIQDYVFKTWDESIVPSLIEYIKIPNKSPAFDPDWQQHGYMDKAIQLAKNWCEQHAPNGMKLDLIQLEGRTPLLFIEIPGNIDETVVMYGHLDKQPELFGWDADKGPWKPVLEGDRLYGRGGADDGYAVFSSLTAINALQKENIPHARCVVIIECCEESGSYDLPHYVTALRDRIGNPNLIICLDSGCGNYEQLWCTTSLRGMMSGDLKVDVLTAGIHSGHGSGVVPDSIRVARSLLSRIEDENTGELCLKELYVDIPERRVEQAKQAGEVLKQEINDAYPFAGDTKPVSNDYTELMLNRTWRPTLTVIGIDGVPSIADAPNTTRAGTALKLSFRLAPTCDAAKASEVIKSTLEANVPYSAQVSFDINESANGWHAPILQDWLREALDAASKNYFNKESMYFGEGGSIPFMGMLGDLFPEAQFVITGVLGPQSNAHGPNEFLHIPTGKKLTCCVAEILSKHYIENK